MAASWFVERIKYISNSCHTHTHEHAHTHTYNLILFFFAFVMMSLVYKLIGEKYFLNFFYVVYKKIYYFVNPFNETSLKSTKHTLILKSLK